MEVEDLNEFLASMDGETKPKSIKSIMENFREEYRVIYMEFITSVDENRYQIANFKFSQLLVEMNLSILYILQSANLDPKQYV